MREIEGKRKHTVVEWNALIRVALFEVNEAIGKESITVENPAAIDFDEYQNFMQRIAKMSDSNSPSLQSAAQRLPGAKYRKD